MNKTYYLDENFDGSSTSDYLIQYNIRVTLPMFGCMGVTPLVSIKNYDCDISPLLYIPKMSTSNLFFRLEKDQILSQYLYFTKKSIPKFNSFLDYYPRKYFKQTYISLYIESLGVMKCSWILFSNKPVRPLLIKVDKKEFPNSILNMKEVDLFNKFIEKSLSSYIEYD